MKWLPSRRARCMSRRTDSSRPEETERPPAPPACCRSRSPQPKCRPKCCSREKADRFRLLSSPRRSSKDPYCPPQGPSRPLCVLSKKLDHTGEESLRGPRSSASRSNRQLVSGLASEVPAPSASSLRLPLTNEPPSQDRIRFCCVETPAPVERWIRVSGGGSRLAEYWALFIFRVLRVLRAPHPLRTEAGKHSLL